MTGKIKQTCRQHNSKSTEAPPTTIRSTHTVTKQKQNKSKAKQSKAKQSKAKQSNAMQCNAMQNKTKQNKTKPNPTKQSRMENVCYKIGKL